MLHRRLSIIGSAACVAALLLTVACAQAQAQTVLRLSRLENIPDQTVGAEILKAVYQHLDIAVEFVDMPAKRSLLESSAGNVDGEVQRISAVGSQYPTLVAVHPSINDIEPSAFVTEAAFRVDGWSSIARYSIGIVRGVGSSELGTRGMPRVDAVATMDQLMQMLAAGRVDVAVNDRFSGLLVVKRLHLDGRVRALEPALEHIPVYHYLHERHRALVPRVEQVIRGMLASGELARVRQQATAKMLADAER